MTPGAYQTVVPGQQHVWYAVPAPARRLRVDRVLQQPVAGVRLLGQRLGVADHTRQEASDSLDHDQYGDLAAVEHVVADGHLVDAHPLPRVRRHARIDALVAPASEGEPGLGCELVRKLLREGAPCRGRYDQTGLRSAIRRCDGVDRLAPWFRLHHHARTAAVRGVVDSPVPVVGPVAQVVQVDVQETALGRLADQ